MFSPSECYNYNAVRFLFLCVCVFRSQWNTRLMSIEEGVAEMQVSAKSFEVRDIPTYMDLKSMRREMKVTKRVWDYINMFRSYVTAWKTSKWKEINFGAIDEVSRCFSRICSQWRSTIVLIQNNCG